MNIVSKIDAEAFEYAKALVTEAGNYICGALAAGYETRWKADNTPVTSIDIAVNHMVIDALHRAYPDDKVYGEEASSGGKTKSGYTWVLDPIDGTQALGKLDTFTVCLARLDTDGQPIFSLILNPSRNELFAAESGEPATLNGEPIHVSSRDAIKSSYVHFGSRLKFDDLASNGVAYDRLEQQGAKILNTRSLAFGCVEVAAGAMDGAFVGVTSPFEAAAVKPIVEGAGGKVTDLYGKETGRLDGEIRGLIVSNGLIHDDLVKALSKK
jgi:myo-inositol-1(or 4)-monophosphatase